MTPTSRPTLKTTGDGFRTLIVRKIVHEPVKTRERGKRWREGNKEERDVAEEKGERGVGEVNHS